MLVQVSKINESIVDTGDLFDARSEYDTIIGELDKAANSTKDGQKSIQDAQSSLDSINFTEYLITVQNSKNSVTDATAQLNTTFLRSAFSNANWSSSISTSILIDLNNTFDNIKSSINSVDLSR